MANPNQMKNAFSIGEEEELDLIGIGFGPANLALSIALKESQEVEERNFTFHFLEKQKSFGWHSSLLLPGAQLQVSPMKDLATMRDPTSSFTFTNYLHTQGRLANFINRESNIPSRRDWSAYLHWAAKRMEDAVSYNREVVNVEPANAVEDISSQTIRRWKITIRDLQTGEVEVKYARNITVAVGGVPAIPDVLLSDYLAKPSHIIHSSAYLPSLASIEKRLRLIESRRLANTSNLTSSMNGQNRQLSAPLRFAVVGSGQSAAEISLHLRNTFPKAHVSLIFRASAIVPSDDSGFVNSQAFDPERTDAFWLAGDEERKSWLKEYRRTNYSVVRTDVLNALHTAIYDQEIELFQPWPHADGPDSHGSLQIRPNLQIDQVQIVNDPASNEEVVRLSLKDLKYVKPCPQIESFDAVFLGTGFQRGPNCLPFLKPLQTHYPRLDSNVDSTKSALGFADELDTTDAFAALGNDESAIERLRRRSRGITRDYRLVSYSSNAFNHYLPKTSSKVSPISSKPASPSLLSDTIALTGGGMNTFRHDGDSSDSSTLADEQEDRITSSLNSSRRQSTCVVIQENEEIQRLRGPKIQSNIYFLGGNEATHGLSDSLLSIVAHRAGELTTSLLKHSQKTVIPSSISLQDSKVPVKSQFSENLNDRVQSMQIVS